VNGEIASVGVCFQKVSVGVYGDRVFLKIDSCGGKNQLLLISERTVYAVVFWKPGGLVFSELDHLCRKD